MKSLKSIYKDESQIKEISIPKALMITTIFVLAPILVSFIFPFIMLLINEKISFGITMIVVSIMTIISSIIVVAITGRKFVKKDMTERIKCKVSITKKEFFYVFLIIIGYILIRNTFLLDALGQFEGPISDNDIDFIFNNSTTIEIGFIGLIFVIQTLITAPIFEELFFRGIILNGLLSKYKNNYKKAIIITALIFGVVHLNIPQGVNGFIGGVILGIIYCYTSSMKLSIFAHFINNSIIFLPIPETLLFKGVYLVLGIYLLTKGIKHLKHNKINSLKENDYNINS